ncbi:hypothetical protein QNO08_16735 [Arthrobacter sp. zg-Y820]|nr:MULTISPECIES: hypothetical protein [unclassified Arthrobacter]MCC9197285.1 hypothetical protein [Arthrobacter sp. zg-Y820]MDK1280150.1 hypothetical protein [Arthrobacter sp. zg.Y820]WIB09442.1 hypothetical protein QNO08_16735 [Arthrobacter sp. zg-Y820]
MPSSSASACSVVAAASYLTLTRDSGTAAAEEGELLNDDAALPASRA